MRLLASVCLLLLISSPLYAADNYYVTDRVLADVHTQPFAGGELLGQLPTGTQVVLLGRQGNYAHVKTSDGTEGWMLAAKLQKQQPAQLLLLALTEQQEHTVAELRRARTELAALRQREENRAISLAQAGSLPTWGFAVIMGLMLMLGFVIGVVWLDYRIRERHGGFRV